MPSLKQFIAHVCVVTCAGCYVVVNDGAGVCRYVWLCCMRAGGGIGWGGMGPPLAREK